MAEDGVPVSPEPSVENRLANFFTPQKSQPVAPVSEEASEVSAPEQAEDSQEGTDQASDEPQGEPPPEGFVELEHLGNKYFVPPDLKTAFEANRAQATKAMMEVAPLRKAVEMERQALQANATFTAQMKDQFAELAKLSSYKEQAKKIDWTALTTDQKIDLDRELRGIDEQIHSLSNNLTQAQHQHQQRLSQMAVEAVVETEKFMAAKVPGWNVDKGKELHEYGAQYGIPEEKLVTGWFTDPAATHIMWKAQQWDRLQSTKPDVTNRANQAPPVVKPGSNQVQKAVASSNYQKMRQNLKKTGSLEAAAAIFRSRMK